MFFSGFFKSKQPVSTREGSAPELPIRNHDEWVELQAGSVGTDKIDPSVWKELPDEIRKEIEQVFI